MNTIRYRYANDKADVANLQKGLRKLMNKLNGVTKEYCIEVSLKKAKVVCISQKGKRKVCLLIDDEQVEQIKSVHVFRNLSALEFTVLVLKHLSKLLYCSHVLSSISKTVKSKADKTINTAN